MEYGATQNLYERFARFQDDGESPRVKTKCGEVHTGAELGLASDAFWEC